MAAKKPTSKTAKTTQKAAKKTPSKKPAAKKPAASKSAARKSTAKKSTPKKAAVKKAAVKKAAAKKAAAKKAAAKKTPAKKTPAKQTPAKQTPAKKAPAKKAQAGKSPARKAVPKKAGTAKSSAPATEALSKPPTNSVATKSPHGAVFVKKQHQRLLDLRDELVDAMSGMTRDTIRNAPEGSEASGSGMHQGDAGSDAYDRDFALSVLAKEQDALYEIEQALRRIAQGSYGVCEMSGEKIPQPRLEAIPFARLTVQCQSQWEKEYGNRRFRPSNEVGFSGGNTLDDEDSDAVLLDEDDE